MNCVCGCPVTDHAKVYDCNYAPWTPALPFTLSGPCRKCGVVGGHDAPRCVGFREMPSSTTVPNYYAFSPGQLRRYPALLIQPSEPEWWKKYDRTQSAGRPEVM